MDKKPDMNNLGYILGYAFGCVCMVCATVATIALTAAIVCWLL